MNKNKGIIGIGLILAIVLGVVVVGGGTYYLGKNKENVNFEKTPENILPVLNEEQNLPVVDNSKKASITVLSPNGGEKFNTTTTIEQIPVSWKSTGITSKNVAIYIENISNISQALPVSIVPDTGTANISTIPLGNYKIKICATYQKKGNLEVEYVPDCSIASDYSDSSFTVNYVAEGVSVAVWKEYSSSEYGFRFNYPGDWKLTEDKIKKEVTIDTNDIGDVVEGGTFPSWRITFKSTDKTFFNNLQPTKMGVITYNEKESAVFADDRCIKGTKLLGGLTQAFTYGGSLMSDPAYSNSAILTKNGEIIIVNSYQGSVITQKLEKQLSTIVNTFKLLNGNSFFIPECSK